MLAGAAVHRVAFQGMKTLFRFIKAALIVLLAGVLTIGCQTLRNSGGGTLLDKPDGALRIATHNVHYSLVHKASGAWSLRSIIWHFAGTSRQLASRWYCAGPSTVAGPVITIPCSSMSNSGHPDSRACLQPLAGDHGCL
jgi:hypothetical protein